MVSRTLFRAVLLQLMCVAICLGQANLNTYSIFWGEVPNYPTAKNLTSTCICDVTQFACDPSCCCDPYCPASVIQAAILDGACLPEGPPSQTLDYCVPASSVVQVNLPSTSDFYSIPVQSPTDKLLDMLLCIVSTSNPKLGDQYPDPPAGNAGNNANLAGCPTPMSALTRSPYYVLNSPIFVNRTGAKSSFPLKVPYPALSMSCSDSFQPGFLMPIPSTQKDVFSVCTRDTTSLLQMCQNSTFDSLSALSYTALQFLNLPSDVTKTVNPFWSVQYLDPSTGNLTQVLSCSPVGAGSACIPPPTPYYLNGMCHNALSSINMTVVYQKISTGLAISQVQMSIVITDISSSYLTYDQSVRMDFVQYFPNDDPNASPTGSRLVQQFSGNPGYLTGFPLLAGTGSNYFSTDGQKYAIQRFIYGFPVPVGNAGSSGQCSPTSLGSVRFGYNSSFTCGKTVDLAYLSNTICKKNGTFIIADLLGGFFTSLQNSNVYVGIWGNSNLTNMDEWIQVVQSNNATPAPLWHPETNTCDNIVVGFNIQVLYGVAFATNNVQRKVLYVNVCYRTASWTYPTNANTGQPPATATFMMESTVQYIALPQTPNINQKKPAPPLAWPLPEDIFYPFVTSGATLVFSSPVLGLLAVFISLVLSGMLV